VGRARWRRDRKLPWPAETEVENDRYDGALPVSGWLADMQRVSVQVAHGSSALARKPWLSARRRQLAFAAAAALLLLVGVGALIERRPPLSQAATTIVETSVGENREVSLTDGSLVIVGAKSLLWVTLAEYKRAVRLERGEAFFRVAKDPSRPFIVSAHETSVTAIGTAFDVRLSGEQVSIAVAEGVVRVQPRAPESVGTRGNHLRGVESAALPLANK